MFHKYPQIKKNGYEPFLMACIVIPIWAVFAITFTTVFDHFYYNDCTDYNRNNNNKW